MTIRRITACLKLHCPTGFVACFNPVRLVFMLSVSAVANSDPAGQETSRKRFLGACDSQAEAHSLKGTGYLIAVWALPKTADVLPFTGAAPVMLLTSSPPLLCHQCALKAEVRTRWVNASTRWVCIGGADTMQGIPAARCYCE